MEIDAISGAATVALASAILFLLVAKSWNAVSRNVGSTPSFADRIMHEAAQRFRDELERLSRSQSTYLSSILVFLVLFGTAYILQAEHLFAGYPRGSSTCRSPSFPWRPDCRLAPWSYDPGPLPGKISARRECRHRSSAAARSQRAPTAFFTTSVRAPASSITYSSGKPASTPSMSSHVAATGRDCGTQRTRAVVLEQRQRHTDCRNLGQYRPTREGNPPAARPQDSRSLGHRRARLGHR